MEEPTRFDRMMRYCQNHPVIAPAMILFLPVAAIVGLWVNLKQLKGEDTQPATPTPPPVVATQAVPAAFVAAATPEPRTPVTTPRPATPRPATPLPAATPIPPPPAPPAPQELKFIDAKLILNSRDKVSCRVYVFANSKGGLKFKIMPNGRSFLPGFANSITLEENPPLGGNLYSGDDSGSQFLTRWLPFSKGVLIDKGSPARSVNRMYYHSWTGKPLQVRFEELVNPESGINRLE